MVERTDRRGAWLRFQSTPPAEARGDVTTRSAVLTTTTWLFQSTPPAEARGDRSVGCQAEGTYSFNPLPPPKRGETCGSLKPNGFVAAWFQSTPPAEARGDATPLAPSPLTDPVSIHSPRRSEGRRAIRRAVDRLGLFQSTPPAEARGDIPASLWLPAVLVFQSTPPAEARGDLPYLVDSLTGVDVSIHSPRRSEGRPVKRTRRRLWVKFQSTPPAEARGDLVWST